MLKQVSEESPVIQGYLVLERPTKVRGMPPEYRGLYRVPPFLIDDWPEDPYMVEGLTSDGGFFSTLEGAEAARKALIELRSGSYEIVFATTGAGAVSTTELGYDVACLAPFWSILADPRAIRPRA